MSDDSVLEETRLANECESEEAVDWSCDCRELFECEVLSVDPAFPFAPDLGLESVFRRLNTPETAYDTGYVKNEEDRFGVERDGGEEDGWEDREESVVVGIE